MGDDLGARAKRAVQRSLARHAQIDESQIDPAKLDRMKDALRRLSLRQRQLLLAIRIGDLSYAEIAELTELSVTAVEQQFAKALANFMANLDDPNRHWWRRWL